jgi:hypothetical protein
MEKKVNEQANRIRTLPAWMIQTNAGRTHNAGNSRQPQRQGGNYDKDEDREGKLYACGLQ